MVSRSKYLEKVISSLELLDCDQSRTNILCIVDGDDALYLRTRNLINDTKFNERLVVRAEVQEPTMQFDIPTRRRHIAAMHNQARALITHDRGYVFSVEDDTTFGSQTLNKLLRVANTERGFGYVEGVELGRWGVPYVGAWVADDIYNPMIINSIENVNPVPEGYPPTPIDAGGLYCALIRADLYKQHTFTCDNGLGPDINFGIENRQLGFRNFILWQVPCIHHYEEMGKEKTITPSAESKVVTMIKENNTKWHVNY
jgi:hypothetical protein